VLAVVSLATILALSIWFSTNAIGPALEREKGFSTSDLSWLTIAVQIGFVAGTLISAALNLADRIPARAFFAGAAGVGALLNAAVVPLDGFGWAFLVRFGTGVALAGVYPTAMKIVSGWFQGGRGAALGAMIAALTIGSGSPHLLRSAFVDNWEVTVYGSSLLAVGGGLLVLAFGADGPFDVRGARFNPKTMFAVFTDRGQRLTLFGYLGHMWELYAMWAWIGAYLAAVYGTRTIFGGGMELSSAMAFAVFGAGAVGSVVGGLGAERQVRAVHRVSADGVDGGYRAGGHRVGGIGHRGLGPVLHGHDGAERAAVPGDGVDVPDGPGVCADGLYHLAGAAA